MWNSPPMWTSFPLGHHEGPPRRRTVPEHGAPIPGRDVRPALATLVADHLANHQRIVAMTGAERAHREMRPVFLERKRSDAEAAAAKAIGSRMQAPRRCADPADDDLATAIGEAADTAWEVAHEASLALRQRQLGQRATLVA